MQLEFENMRKKIKRVTGELEVLETYFSSFHTLLKQVIPHQNDYLTKVLKSIEESLDYMKELFSQSRLVTSGKRVQRKVRYEKLKTAR